MQVNCDNKNNIDTLPTNSTAENYCATGSLKFRQFPSAPSILLYIYVQYPCIHNLTKKPVSCIVIESWIMMITIIIIMYLIFRKKSYNRRRRKY